METSNNSDLYPNKSLQSEMHLEDTNQFKKLHFKFFELRNTCIWKLSINYETEKIDKLTIDIKRFNEPVPFADVNLLNIKDTFLWANTLIYKEDDMKNCSDIEFILKIYLNNTNVKIKQYKFTKPVNFFESGITKCALLTLINEDLLIEYIKDPDNEFFSNIKNYIENKNDSNKSVSNESNISNEKNLDTLNYTFSSEYTFFYNDEDNTENKIDNEQKNFNKIYGFSESKNDNEENADFEKLQNFFEDLNQILSNVCFEPFLKLLADWKKEKFHLKNIESKNCQK